MENRAYQAFKWSTSIAFFGALFLYHTYQSDKEINSNSFMSNNGLAIELTLEDSLARKTASFHKEPIPLFPQAITQSVHRRSFQRTRKLPPKLRKVKKKSSVAVAKAPSTAPAKISLPVGEFKVYQVTLPGNTAKYRKNGYLSGSGELSVDFDQQKRVYNYSITGLTITNNMEFNKNLVGNAEYEYDTKGSTSNMMFTYQDGNQIFPISIMKTGNSEYVLNIVNGQFKGAKFYLSNDSDKMYTYEEMLETNIALLDEKVKAKERVINGNAMDTNNKDDVVADNQFNHRKFHNNEILDEEEYLEEEVYEETGDVI